jgi:hypothetical protein
MVSDAGFAVFYDDFYPKHLWGKNLTTFFDEMHRKRAGSALPWYRRITKTEN